ncbi:hypothetical protein RYX36_013703 [Vicia faba]
MLVYEFMENGSLAEHLRSNGLNWSKRFDIALGTARGLAYIHEECLEWILHCDVKPHNILLDSDYQPKVADFGLCILMDALNYNGVSHGVFNDTGNFMFEDGDFNSLWENFKFTSDTLLPSQVVEKGGKLSSRLNETYFNKGSANLNFDGVFTLFKHPRNSTESEGWTIVWSKPDIICAYTVNSGSGVCGYNSFCTLGQDKRPTCQCPKSYSLVNPGDPYGSCKPDFIQGCEEDELRKIKDLYYFKVLINTDWPLSEFVLQRLFTEE